MKIGEVNIYYPNYSRVNISRCAVGVYLRWWYNGWHYYNFTNGYDIAMNTDSMDTQITQMFSVISRIEHPTQLKAEYSYTITISGIQPQNVSGFTGLLMAEKVELRDREMFIHKVRHDAHLVVKERGVQELQGCTGTEQDRKSVV